MSNPNIYSQKRASCDKSVDILQQVVTTSRYQDASELQESFGYAGITREEGLLYVRSVRKV